MSSSHSLHEEANANLTGVKGSFCHPPIVRDCTHPTPSPQAVSTSCSSATIPNDGLQVSVRCGVLDRTFQVTESHHYFIVHYVFLEDKM